MDPTRDPRPPDAQALDWLDAHLGADDAALIEALPDEAVHAELRELGLDPARIQALPGMAPVPPVRAEHRVQAAARPPARNAATRRPRWRAPWAYALASLLFVGVVSVAVLRDTREQTAPASGSTTGSTAGDAEPMEEEASDAVTADGAKTAKAPGAEKRAQPAAPAAASRNTSPAEADAEDAPVASPQADVQESAASQAAPVLAAPPPSAREEALRPETQPRAGAAAPRMRAAESAEASIPRLLRAYQAATARDADSLLRRRLSKELSAAYTAAGDTAEARRWAKRDQLP